MDSVAPISLVPLPRLTEPPWNDKGGEAFIYEHPTDKDFLVKVFHVDRVRSGRRGANAQHLTDLNSFSDGLSPSQSKRLSDCFSWPATLYGSTPDCIDGIAIRRADDVFWLDYEDVYGWNHKVQNLAYLGNFLKAPIIKTAPYVDISFEDRIEIAMEFLRAMQVLWQLGYRYCDYSENNLLWAFEPRPRVFIIDAESCSRPGTRGLRSPGWNPLDRLGFTLEADRSQCAMLIWRVMNGDMNVFPPDLSSSKFARNLGRQTIDLMTKLYGSGTESLALDLLDDLKQYRGTENIDRAFEWAVTTQFASIVLDYAPANPTPSQREIIARANEQQVLEEEIQSLEPNLRRYRLAHAVPVSGFEFDISTQSTNVSLEHDAELLRELALNGEFDQIAEIFAVSEQSMTINRVVTRAIQVALAQFGAPKIVNGPVASGSQRFEWGWPGASFVNCARIEIIDPSGLVINEAIAYRKRSKSGVTLPIDDAYPVNSVLKLSLGLVTPNNQHVYCPLSGEVLIATSGARRVPPTVPMTAPVQPPKVDFEPRTWGLPTVAPPVPAQQVLSNPNLNSAAYPASISKPTRKVGELFRRLLGRRL